MANTHHAHVYNTFEEFVRSRSAVFHQGGPNNGLVTYEKLEPRYMRAAVRIWKRHVEKNGNVPLVQRCSVCSGEEHRLDIKHGRYKPARPSKVLRDEEKQTEE